MIKIYSSRILPELDSHTLHRVTVKKFRIKNKADNQINIKKPKKYITTISFNFFQKYIRNTFVKHFTLHFYWLIVKVAEIFDQVLTNYTTRLLIQNWTEYWNSFSRVTFLVIALKSLTDHNKPLKNGIFHDHFLLGQGKPVRIILME